MAESDDEIEVKNEITKKMPDCLRRDYLKQYDGKRSEWISQNVMRSCSIVDLTVVSSNETDRSKLKCSRDPNSEPTSSGSFPKKFTPSTDALRSPQDRTALDPDPHGGGGGSGDDLFDAYRRSLLRGGRGQLRYRLMSPRSRRMNVESEVGRRRSDGQGPSDAPSNRFENPQSPVQNSMENRGTVRSFKRNRRAEDSEDDPFDAYGSPVFRGREDQGQYRSISPRSHRMDTESGVGRRRSDGQGPSDAPSDRFENPQSPVSNLMENRGMVRSFESNRRAEASGGFRSKYSLSRNPNSEPSSSGFPPKQFTTSDDAFRSSQDQNAVDSDDDVETRRSKYQWYGDPDFDSSSSSESSESVDDSSDEGGRNAGYSSTSDVEFDSVDIEECNENEDDPSAALLLAPDSSKNFNDRYAYTPFKIQYVMGNYEKNASGRLSATKDYSEFVNPGAISQVAAVVWR